MRWTERQVDSFDRIEQLSALNSTLEFLKKCGEKRALANEVDQKIAEVTKKADQIKMGFSIKVLLVAAGIAMILLSFLVGINAAFFLVLLLLIVYVIVDKTKFSQAREDKAKSFLAENMPSLNQQKNLIETELNTLYSSDDAYNAKLLLPDEYISVERVQTLVNILRQKRARSISEAMMFFENMEHQKRLESIELEKLKAAQETAEAQKRVADAAKNTEQLTRQMAKEQRENAARQQEAAQRAAAAAAASSSTSREKRGRRRRPCPCCGELIIYDASKCPYCHCTPSKHALFWGW